MNILLLSWRDSKHPWAGGAEQVMHEHAKGWVAAGHRVTLFSSKYKGCRKRRETIDGVEVVRYGNQYLGVHLFAFLWYFAGRHQKFDIVIDQFHGLPFFTPLYVRTPKLAVIQETAEKVWFFNPLPQPFRFLVGWIGYLLEPLFFLFYVKVPFMTGSESGKKNLLKFHIPEENITVVQHGTVLYKLNKIPNKERTRTVIYLGAVNRDKGAGDAIETFSLLNKLGKYQFWMVGRPEDKYYLSLLHDKAKRLGLTENLIFWGYVSQEDKFKLLARAHVMINPSMREGWGLVNIEANSMGVPVIAFSSPGLVDSVKDDVSGLIVKNNTPKELAKTVEGVLKNKTLYQKLSLGARDWSKQFSWENSRKLSLELIENICEFKKP